MAPVGSLVILHNQALALLPQFYLGSALIVGGFKAQQQVWRTSSLQATILAVVAEVAWTGLHPQPLPQAVAAWTLLGALLLNALHVSTLYGLVDGLAYTPDLAFALALARALLLIPANQMGNAWTLSEGAERSQARWRIGGWIVTVALGLAVLLLPVLASSPACVIATISAPSAVTAAVLLLRPAPVPTSGGNTNSSPLSARVTWQRALLFIVGACILGTNGEAVLDSAVGMTVRNSLIKGNATLALANQSAVLASMLLALLSEVALLSGSAASRSATYIMLWLSVQLVRAVGFGYLTNDETGALLANTRRNPHHSFKKRNFSERFLVVVQVWAFVFVDKYTGPLGNAAVETSLLQTLQQGQEQQEQPPTGKPKHCSSRSPAPGKRRSKPSRRPSPSPATTTAVRFSVRAQAIPTTT